MLIQNLGQSARPAIRLARHIPAIITHPLKTRKVRESFWDGRVLDVVLIAARI
jgi:hypothetical protein